MLQKRAAKFRFSRLTAVENELKKQAPAPFPLSRALRILPERSPLYMILQKSGLFEQFLLQIRSRTKPVFLILHCIILDNGFSILQSTRCFYNSGKSLHVCFIIESPVYHQFHTRIIAKMLQKRRPIPLRQPTPCIRDTIRSCKFFTWRPIYILTVRPKTRGKIATFATRFLEHTRKVCKTVHYSIIA